jgi:hypothetical protein
MRRGEYITLSAVRLLRDGPRPRPAPTSRPRWANSVPATFILLCPFRGSGINTRVQRCSTLTVASLATYARP